MATPVKKVTTRPPAGRVDPARSTGNTQGADMAQRVAALNKAGQSYRTGKPTPTPKPVAAVTRNTPTPMPTGPMPSGDTLKRANLTQPRLVDDSTKRPSLEARMAGRGIPSSAETKTAMTQEVRKRQLATNQGAAGSKLRHTASPNARAMARANENASFKRTMSPSAKRKSKNLGQANKAMDKANTKNTLGWRKRPTTATTKEGTTP